VVGAGEPTLRLAGLHPGLRTNAQWTLDVADFYGVPVNVTSVYRSWTAQKRLRELWLAGKSRFPANRPGDSAHNFGLAWDSTVAPEYQAWWDAVRRFAGFEVLPNDLIHAQLTSWRDFAGSPSA